MSEILLPPMSVAVEIEIPFHDVDTMHIVWHGHYLKYFEIARCKLLDEFDYNYPQMLDSGHCGPSSMCKFVTFMAFCSPKKSVWWPLCLNGKTASKSNMWFTMPTVASA